MSKGRRMVSSLWRHVLALTLMWPLAASTAPLGTIEGVVIDDVCVVGGQPLLLNGAASHRRGYQKVAVVSLFLPGRASNINQAEAMAGSKRIRVDVLRDVTGSMASRYFINDFTNMTTTDEFKSLIPLVSEIGAQYGKLALVKKGDVIQYDWLPGQGLVVTLNGRLMWNAREAGASVASSELLYRVHLRMYTKSAVAEVEDNMFGRSRSMMMAVAR